MQNRLHIKVEIEHQIDGRTSVNSTAVYLLLDKQSHLNNALLSYLNMNSFRQKQFCLKTKLLI